MFKSEFQGGPHVEVFSCQGKEPLAKWKLTGSASINKVYEKEAKSFVHVLEGAGTSTKIQLPKDSKQTLALVQRFLVLQVNILLGQDFSVELGVSDMGNNKRRLLFSTAQREIAATPLHTKIPLTIVRRSVWLNLCIDLVSVVSEAFRGQTYKTLDSLTVSASCHLRKIFTMKTQPADNTEDDDLYDCSPPTNNVELDSIPRSCQFSVDVAFQTQVLNMNKLRHAEFKLKPDSRPCSSAEPVDLNSSLKGRKDIPTHIAFGKKVPVPSIPTGRKTSSAGSLREGTDSASNRSARATHSRSQKQDGDPIPSDRSVSAKKESNAQPVSGRQRLASDPRTGTADMDLSNGLLKGGNSQPAESEINKDDNFVQPHPPRKKSADKSRRVVKVRPNSGKRERGDSLSAGSDTSTSGPNAYDKNRYTDPHAPRKDSEESSDADRPTRASDAAILKIASSRIRVDTPEDQSRDEEHTNEPNSSRLVQRPRLDSLSESDDITTQNMQKGRTQRRRKKADRPLPPNRLDSLSENEEAQRRRSGKGRGDGGGVSKNGQREKKESSVSMVMEKLSDTTMGDSRLADVQSTRRLKPLEEKSNKGKPKQPTTAKLVNKQNRTEENISSSDQQERDILYTFMSPPRSTSLRQIEKSRQLEPQKLQKISETSPHFPPTPPDGDSPLRRSLSPLSPVNGELSSRSRYDAIIRRTPSPRRTRSPQNSSGDFSDQRKYDTDSPRPIASISPLPTRKSQLTEEALTSNLRGSDASPLRNSLSRLSIHKLREIPKTDPRLSDELDWMRHQSNNSSLASSLEANMLASLRRQQLEEMYEDDPNEDGHQRAENSFENYADDDLSSSSDDTATTYSTFRPPGAALRTHRYQDEMHFPSNSNPLMKSNPRDWANLFSPPIVLPSQKLNEASVLSPGKDMPAAFRMDKVRTKSTSSDDRSRVPTESEDEELDLLYDPCLNCYFDPKTGKYYELK